MSADGILDKVARREARRRAAEDLARALADRVEAMAEGRPAPGPTESQEAWFVEAMAYADRLVAGEVAAWRVLLARLAVTEGLSLSSGPGGRLMAMSPFAGKAAMVLDNFMGFGTLRGDAVRLAERAVEHSGQRPAAGTSFLILVDPDVLWGATVVEARRR